jgi:hypothetical protein
MGRVTLTHLPRDPITLEGASLTGVRLYASFPIRDEGVASEGFLALK